MLSPQVFRVVVTVLAIGYPMLQGLVIGVSAMLLHEVGHIIMCLALGVKVKSIEWQWTKGMALTREAGCSSKNFIISISGPLMNFALLLVCLPMHWNVFAIANLCFSESTFCPFRVQTVTGRGPAGTNFKGRNCMAIENVIKCDVCGISKGLTNHWHRVRVDANGLHILASGVTSLPGDKDVCGQGHLHTLVDEFAENQRGIAAKAA